MENQLIMLQTVTTAVRAKNVLEAAGIHAYVEKTPKNSLNSSCGYSVFVPYRTDDAERILVQRGFPVLGRTGRVVL